MNRYDQYLFIKSKHEDKKNLEIINKQIIDYQRKLDKLYEALESGRFDFEVLSPGIKRIKDDLDTLLGQRQLLTEELYGNGYPISLFKRNQCRYQRFHRLLASGSLNDQKKFVNLFIKKINIKNR